MKILLDRKIKLLFLQIMAAAGVFALLSVVLIIRNTKNSVIYVFIAALMLVASLLIALFCYFQAEHKKMEQAVDRITEYLAGNSSARIVCDDEGELNRLFHEVNSLVSILNAHAENEGRARHFLKDTLSDISHQLKTPLAALNIYNGILQENPADAATVKEFAALSEQELDRIETLVQNLLKITKLDAGTIILEKETENIADLMASLERRFSILAQQQDKVLTFSGAEDILLVCDPHWLEEAVGNLIKNALDHTKAGNSIHVTWQAFASIVQIVVADNGCGIHPEDLPHIFKRFYRSRFSKDTQGIGLGLSLAKAIVEAHNGTIEVDSELGMGSTFTINFLNPTKL